MNLGSRELGRKHTCSKCLTKFYDLGRPDPRCPKCNTPVEINFDFSRSKTRDETSLLDDEIIDDTELEDTFEEPPDEEDLLEDQDILE